MMAVSASMCVICWFCAQTTNKHRENGRWCGLSCSYLPTYVPRIILIKCVRTHSYSIAIAQILRKAFTYITFWFATTLFLSPSLSRHFFQSQWKKTATKNTTAAISQTYTMILVCVCDSLFIFNLLFRLHALEALIFISTFSY